MRACHQLRYRGKIDRRRTPEQALRALPPNIVFSNSVTCSGLTWSSAWG